MAKTITRVSATRCKDLQELIDVVNVRIENQEKFGWSVKNIQFINDKISHTAIIIFYKTI